MSRQIKFYLNDEELGNFDKALELSGMRSRAELVRFLVAQYINQQYCVEKTLKKRCENNIDLK